jgi:hypothetical protein
VAKQVQKENDCNSDMIAEYLTEVRRMEKFFDGFEARYVPRLDNRDANHMAWIASSRAPTPPDVIIERLFKPSVKPEESIGQAELELMIIDEPAHQPVDDWMSLIRAYLDNQPPSDDNIEVKRIACNSRMYHLIDGVLFHQGANEMMMKCISREEGMELLEDVHRCVCGSHSSWCSIVCKAYMLGFYWPTVKDDAMEVVKKCRDCKFYQKQTMKNANPLRPIDVSWPFAIWGIDIIGVLPRAPGGFRYLFIRVNTFTK